MTECKRCGDTQGDRYNGWDGHRGAFGYSHLCDGCYDDLEIGEEQCN